MSKSLAIAVSLTLAAAIAAHAQNVRQPVAPEPLVPGQADMMRLQTAMIAAQQAAIKPGDEALPCAALDKELVSTMNSPAIQAYAARTNPATTRAVARISASNQSGADRYAMTPVMNTARCAGCSPFIRNKRRFMRLVTS